MKAALSIIFVFSLFTYLLAQEASNQYWSNEGFHRGEGNNYQPTSWNPIIGLSHTDIVNSPDAPSLLNNFICDAMLERTETDFSFINYGDINYSLYKGEITKLDLYALCPFNRALVVLEVDGAFLMNLVEKCLSGFRTGLAVGGAKIEYSKERPSGNRLTFFQIGNYPAYPKKEYRVVTTDYLADGHAGFTVLTHLDSAKVFRTNILLREAVKQYIEGHTPLGPASIRLDNRCIKKP